MPPLDTPHPAPISTSQSCYAFTDANGLTWDLRLRLSDAARIDRSNFSVVTSKKLSLMAEPQSVLVEALTNPGYLFALIWCVVSRRFPPANGENAHGQPMKVFTEDDFMDGIDGPTIEKAQTALVQALMDFFPAQRTSLGKVAASLSDARRTLETKAGELIDRKTEEGIAHLLAEMEKDAKTPGDASSASSEPPAVAPHGATSTSEN